MYVVVGLGNPGRKYEGTRHNAGHMVVEELARRSGGRLANHQQTQTHHLSARVGAAPGREGEQIILAECNTEMNVSGGPISLLLKYYGCPPERLIVVHDDMDLPFGTIRLKRGGGDGGHNGLKSTAAALGTKNYMRVRFGIGHPGTPEHRGNVVNWVLGRPTGKDAKALPLLISDAADAVEAVLTDGFDRAQNTVNARG